MHKINTQFSCCSKPTKAHLIVLCQVDPENVSHSQSTLQSTNHKHTFILIQLTINEKKVDTREGMVV